MRARNFIAGLSVAGLLLPEAVAYAAIAGLPVQRAVMAAILGCLAYAAVGGSRFAIVSPTSSSAAIVAATLAAMPISGNQRADLATAVVLAVAALFLLAALVRLGGLTQMVSRPVLRGFAFGVAATVILRQWPQMVGVEVASGSLWALLREVWAQAWQGWSLGIGLAALALYYLLKPFRALPGALIVLAAGIAASLALGLAGRGVVMVGAISLRLEWPGLPALNFAQWSGLLPYVVPLVLILFAESWGTISGLATAHGDRVSPNRELAALGLANLAAGLGRGMPVGAGFSAGMAAEAAGAKGRAAGGIAGLALVALVWLAAPLLPALPEPVLAAVVIGTLSHGLHPGPFLRLWRLGRDFWIAVAAAAAVLLFGVLNGMLIAVAVSLIAMLRRLVAPRMVALGRLPGSQSFVDMSRHPEAETPAGLTLLRPSEPLFFGNAAPILALVADRVAASRAAKAVVLSLEETFDLDSSALDELLAFDRAMRRAGVRLQLARVHDHVRDVLAAAEADDLIARSSYSVADAVAALGVTAA